VLIGHRKIPNFDRPQVLVMDDGSQVHVAMWATTVANLWWRRGTPPDSSIVKPGCVTPIRKRPPCHSVA